MSENRNEANTTNRPHRALVNLLLFIESVVAELKSEANDASWLGTTVDHHARQAISHLIQMAWSVQGLTGATTPYFAGAVDGVNRLVARPQWGELIKHLPTPPQLPEHWLIDHAMGNFSEGLSPEDAEFIMNMDR